MLPQAPGIGERTGVGRNGERLVGGGRPESNPVFQQGRWTALVHGAEGIRDGAPPGLRGSANSKETKKDPPAKVALGKPYDTGAFTVEVLGASIRRPEVKGITGFTSRSDEPLLVVEMRFSNKNDRKLVTFRDERALGGSVLRLRDDVGNVVRPVAFGLGNNVVGALDTPADVKPGESVTHLQVFDVPLPKTKSLVLNVDLYCCEGKGEVEIEIPIAAVKKEGD
jgi:hypothetical protein